LEPWYALNDSSRTVWDLIALENFIFDEGQRFTHSAKVLNVVPGDFTHTGKLDLLVMSQGRNKDETDMHVYRSIPNKGFGE